MKVYMCVLVVVAAAASAVSTSQQQPASQAAQTSTQTQSQTSSSSSSSSQGTPSQVANKRGDTDFATSASQTQPVYSPSISQQQSAHPQSPSAADYSSAASNQNLYYYYYPASSPNGKSESAGSDPYVASAASAYPSYASDGSSHGHQHSGYESSGPSYGGSGYPSQLQHAYAQQGPSGTPQYSYGGQLLPSDSQINAQYSSGSGAPVSGYPSQASYPAQGAYQSSPSTFNPTYAAPADSKSRFYGLGSVIMPLVGLGALAFLLPSVTNLGGKKKTKRSVESVEPNNVAEYAERLEKYFKIYRAAVESEDCMNRIFCEVGDAVSTVRGKAALLALFEKVAPQWMTGKMGVFKFGALSDKSAKCARYKCA